MVENTVNPILEAYAVFTFAIFLKPAILFAKLILMEPMLLI